MRLTPGAPARAGTTLLELTVVIVLLGLILGGILSVVGRQQRFYRETSATSAARSQVRQAAAILPAELRGLAPAAGDIIQALDSALEFHSTIASGVVCERGPDWLALVPPRAGVDALRGELLPPAAGDVARVLVPDHSEPRRDRWPAFPVTSASEEVTVCRDGPFIRPEDAGQPRLHLSLGAPLPAVVRAGAPVRITRAVRYSLYRSNDRLWYLGANEWTEGRWTGIQPVSGPYAAYRRGVGGVRFEYADDSGAVLEEPIDPSRIALIRLTVRSAAASPGAARPSSRTAMLLADSAIVEVALRNRPR